MSGFKIAHLEEIEEMNDGRQPWRPVRHYFGIESFGINSWTAVNAGDQIINEHSEEGEQEELYVVTEGRARFELDGESRDAPTGTYVFVEPGVKRTAFAEEAPTTVLAIGGTRGQAYVVEGWELWAPCNRFYLAGEYAKAADCLKPVAAANPQYAGLTYNLACCESLAGRKEDAITHLRDAVERSERMRDYAKTDTDLDPIRGEPGFPELSSTN